MFRAISVRIALQFTVFVALLLLINGSLFLAADYRVARQNMDQRLLRESHRIADRLPANLSLSGSRFLLPPREREMVRIVDSKGRPVYTGGLFSSTEFNPENPDENADRPIEGEQMHIVTIPIVRMGKTIGFFQIADNQEVRFSDVPERVLVYLMISGVITILTFFVGLFFAKRSLKPAEAAMQRLEQFTQDASHELRTPLAVLGSSLDLALKTEKYRSGILSAKDDLKRIAVLVERLLEMARLDKLALEFKPFDLSALVSQVIAQYAPLTAKKYLTVSQDIENGVQVMGDETLITQAIGNLLSNAIKFTPDKGTITVKLTAQALSISDTGIGIPQNALPMIFSRFYQVDSSRSHGGFGLGLALVKRIIDLHGWSIEVKSKQGKGTAFLIRFTPFEAKK